MNDIIESRKYQSKNKFFTKQEKQVDFVQHNKATCNEWLNLKDQALKQHKIEENQRTSYALYRRKQSEEALRQANQSDLVRWEVYKE